MAALFLTALTLGMIGSFHCIGMCGPLAFSLPMKTDSDWSKFSGSFLYNMGRIVTYSVLGIAFGIAGKSFSFFGFQQWLSISIGTIILLFLVVPKSWMTLVGKSNRITAYNQAVRSLLGQLFLKKTYPALFSIGVLNGLLPCGLIYMAIAGAIATADPVRSAFFMASFGLGTLPVMWSVSFFGNYIGIGLRQKIRGAYPIMMAMMACLLIVRGMGLGIPYVSPSLKYNVKDIQQCYPAVRNSQPSI
jgi:sulfite exporter TauE/SafE